MAKAGEGSGEALSQEVLQKPKVTKTAFCVSETKAAVQVMEEPDRSNFRTR